MDELTPAQFAELRDKALSAVHASIKDELESLILREIVKARLDLETEIKLAISAQTKILEQLLPRMDDIEGRFSKMERADQYAITRRAIVKLLEQQDAD